MHIIILTNLFGNLVNADIREAHVYMGNYMDTVVFTGQFAFGNYDFPVNRGRRIGVFSLYL